MCLSCSELDIWHHGAEQRLCLCCVAWDVHPILIPAWGSWGETYLKLIPFFIVEIKDLRPCLCLFRLFYCSNLVFFRWGNRLKTVWSWSSVTSFQLQVQMSVHTNTKCQYIPIHTNTCNTYQNNTYQYIPIHSKIQTTIHTNAYHEVQYLPLHTHNFTEVVLLVTMWMYCAVTLVPDPETVLTLSPV